MKKGCKFAGRAQDQNIVIDNGLDLKKLMGAIKMLESSEMPDTATLYLIDTKHNRKLVKRYRKDIKRIDRKYKS
jgi:hypothetical protein